MFVIRSLMAAPERAQAKLETQLPAWLPGAPQVFAWPMDLWKEPGSASSSRRAPVSRGRIRSLKVRYTKEVQEAGYTILMAPRMAPIPL